MSHRVRLRPVSLLRPVLGFVAILLTGCVELTDERDRPALLRVSLDPAAATEPRHVPVNHLGVVALPPELRRVVLLPVCGGGLLPPETAAGLDPLFAAALQERLRFEVVPVSRAWCRRYFGADEFSSAAALPHDFLARLGAEHAADAVLFVDVTAYQDNRPLTFGVRAKLATVTGPRVIWTYDEILSAADPAVAGSARAHARATARADLPVDLSASALQSPSRFAAYVAATVFGTLPPR
jgi:hypothetical protein